MMEVDEGAMSNYDCTADVQEHIRKVRYWLTGFEEVLKRRAAAHDRSKLDDPVEKGMFNKWTPNLESVEFGSDEYKQALEGMGEALQRHYKANRHHPEHYENGVNGMTLHDVVEMLCDWLAAAQKKETHIDLDYLAERFGLAPQLVDIFANTLREDDYWNQVAGVPVVYFCPPDKRDEPIDFTGAGWVGMGSTGE